MSDPTGKKKKIVITVVIVIVVLLLAIALIFLKERSGAQLLEDSFETGTAAAKESASETAQSATAANGQDIVESETAWPEAEIVLVQEETEATADTSFRGRFRPYVKVDVDKAYVTPASYTEVRESYPDVIGYLSIEDTIIEDALFQSPVDDTLYLDHDRDGKGSSAGELFTENRYNGIDFTDPVTIVYGHNMRSGKKFGFLQEYYEGTRENLSPGEAARKHQTITVALPDGELTYTVFAALPYSNIHILASYDFESPLASYRFFSGIQTTRVLGGYVDRGVDITTKDRVLILSTCTADHEGRFLVLARLTGARTAE